MGNGNLEFLPNFQFLISNCVLRSLMEAQKIQVFEDFGKEKAIKKGCLIWWDEYLKPKPLTPYSLINKINRFALNCKQYFVKEIVCSKSFCQEKNN